MQDLDRTFRSLDELPTPDVWDEALAREHQTRPSPRPAHRLLTVGVALGVFAAVALVGWRIFTPSGAPPLGANGRPHEEMGLRISVPHGWHVLSFSTDWGPSPTSGFYVSNVVLPAPAAVRGTPVQASGTTLPRDGVALVLYEGTFSGPRLTTLPLTTSDFSYGSALAGAPTLDVASFTGNGRTYVLTVRIGPNVSSIDRRAANQAIRSIGWVAGSNLTMRRNLILDPPIDSERFAPPNASPLLSPKQALTTFESIDRAYRLPAGSTIWLGSYTAAVGDGTYRFHDRLAYGIRSHQCIPSQNPGYTGPTLCTRWLFLDADTG
ncbi:MAG: hypothetical protein M3P18_23945, partial [Actinomycetota bacterium]|nr:hypothetical protein [Actinomycetota bacterium]